MRRLLLSTALSLIAAPVFAEDAALLLGMDRYLTLDRFSGGTDITDTADDLRNAGYTVDALENPAADAMRAMLTRLHTRSDDAERLIVVLAGRFVTDGKRSWILSVNAPAPTLFGLEQEAVSIESVLRVLTNTPGKSVLMLAGDMQATDAFGPVLRHGLGALEIPQGVTVIQGNPRSLNRLIADAVVTPRADIMSAVAGSRRLDIDGFQPETLVMQTAEIPVTDTAPRPVIVDQQAEIDMWEQAKRTDTEQGYRAYLREYPRGAFAIDAANAVAAISSEPNRAARLVEDSYNLTRDQRRSIQRDLSILNYDTRGIDGIYGPGTRNAILNWQQENGFAQTSYLTSEQITRIDAQAARRSAQLEQEAAVARAEELRLDRAYWEQNGANGRKPGLRRYLDRYPDGIYADQATAQLNQIEENQLGRADRADRDAWTAARNRNTPKAYEKYIKDFRNGAFRDEAQVRLNALRQDQSNAASNDQARAAEAALGLNVLTRRMIEGRLSQLGLNPGPVDGRFNDRSRRAIRQFQRSRNLDPTGFLTQSALVQLLLPSGN
ncbi:MAG: peptidoglycan-binding protein [Yoonia sp.]|nr:peptidoglycan-binding protein [Yoonia sp.]